MSPIAIIPTPLAQAAAAARNPRNEGTCGIHDIAGRIGQAHRSESYICKTIDAYITAAGFPAPFPIVRGGKLVAGAHKDSRWPLVAVDAWFDSLLPPGARGAIDQADRVAIDSRLNARALSLFGGDAA